MVKNLLQPYKGKISRSDRWSINNHKSALVWITGLPGAGKSTISHELEYALFHRGIRAYVLDGDSVRQGLSKDLGFSAADRRENLRRVGEVSRLFTDAGILVIAAFASPYTSDRFMVRGLFDRGEFIEVYLQCALSVCESRDPKGMYKKARKGDIKNFTGISDPYEPPEHPEIILATDRMSIEESVEKIVGYLKDKGVIP
jgi:adenylylsulfate kinase